MFRPVPLGLGALVVLSALATGATEPGTPMDCSDLVLAPGLSCSPFSNPGDGGFRQNQSVVTNDGEILFTGSNSTSDITADLGSCGETALYEMALVYERGVGGLRTPVVSGRDRCQEESTSTSERIRAASILFDSVEGTLLVTLLSLCSSRQGDFCDDYGGGSWIGRIEGFTPLAEVLRERRHQGRHCDKRRGRRTHSRHGSQAEECPP